MEDIALLVCSKDYVVVIVDSVLSSTSSSHIVKLFLQTRAITIVDIAGTSFVGVGGALACDVNGAVDCSVDAALKFSLVVQMKIEAE